MSVSLFLLYQSVHLYYFYIPHLSDTIWYLSFRLWLTSLRMIISRSIHVAANGSNIYLFLLFFFFIMAECLRGKESACNAGDTGDRISIPGLGRSPGGRYGNPLQYSCLENSMHRGAWRATVHGVTKNQTQLQWPSSAPLYVCTTFLSIHLLLDL